MQGTCPYLNRFLIVTIKHINKVNHYIIEIIGLLIMYCTFWKGNCSSADLQQWRSNLKSVLFIHHNLFRYLSQHYPQLNPSLGYDLLHTVHPSLLLPIHFHCTILYCMCYLIKCGTRSIKRRNPPLHAVLYIITLGCYTLQELFFLVIKCCNFFFLFPRHPFSLTIPRSFVQSR